MKPTLNQEIESSQKGIDYVNSLKEKEEVIHPNVWINIPQPPNHVFTKQQMIYLGISNNLPEFM